MASNVNPLASLRTERLTLHRLAESDLGSLHAMHLDEQVMKTLGGVRDRAQTQATLAELMEHWTTYDFGWWSVFLQEEGAVGEGRFLGRGGLRHVQVAGQDEVEVGYGLVADAWGNGYASEIARASIWTAFERLGLDALVSFTMPDNAASRNVMEKCGFEFDRDFVYKGWPHVLYRLSTERWREHDEGAAPPPRFGN